MGQPDKNGRVELELPPKLIPVFAGEADFRGAYGGRGSAKTVSFAKMTAVFGMRAAKKGRRGVIVCGREWMNSLDESSLAEVKMAILSEPWLADFYDVGEKYIRSRCGRITYAFIGLRRNLDSIKSKAKILLLWVDEGEPVSGPAWHKAINTVREEGAEVWVTWNPESDKSATHKRFRENPPDRSKFVELNWRDNPWFTELLERRRQDDLKNRPEQYDHIWEGGFVTSLEGAYWARDLALAKDQGRICNLNRDPLMSVYAVFDIGGTGSKADACSIWIVQFISRELRFIDYYEARGQPLSTHVQWLRDNGYEKAEIILPHDGTTHDRVFDATFEGALITAGFSTRTIPNQGPGAAKMRIEAARRVFHKIWFDDEKTKAGRDALGWYHERQSDDDRHIGLGPAHDWSSHAADSFGLACVIHEEPQPEQKRERRRQGSWMGA